MSEPVLSGGAKYPRSAMITISDRLIEQADETVDVFRLALNEALREAGLEDGERYDVRLTVVEAVEG